VNLNLDVTPLCHRRDPSGVFCAPRAPCGKLVGREQTDTQTQQHKALQAQQHSSLDADNQVFTLMKQQNTWAHNQERKTQGTHTKQTAMCKHTRSLGRETAPPKGALKQGERTQATSHSNNNKQKRN